MSPSDRQRLIDWIDTEPIVDLILDELGEEQTTLQEAKDLWYRALETLYQHLASVRFYE